MKHVPLFVSFIIFITVICGLYIYIYEISREADPQVEAQRRQFINIEACILAIVLVLGIIVTVVIYNFKKDLDTIPDIKEIPEPEEKSEDDRIFIIDDQPRPICIVS